MGIGNLSEEKPRQNYLTIDFPGTIANIEFNLDDSSYYQLKSEVSLDNIFNTFALWKI